MSPGERACEWVNRVLGLCEACGLRFRAPGSRFCGDCNEAEARIRAEIEAVHRERREREGKAP